MEKEILIEKDLKDLENFETLELYNKIKEMLKHLQNSILEIKDEEDE